MAAIDAQRDFWIADAELDAAMTAGGESGMRRASPRAAMPGGGRAAH